METTVSADDLTYEFVEKKDIKFVTVRRKSDGEIIKSQMGRPVSINKKFSMSINLGDISKGFGIGGSFDREKMIQYEWMQVAIPQKESTSKSEPQMIVKTPDYIQDIDEIVTKVTGAPFARTSQTLFTESPIKPNDMRMDISAASCPVLTIKAKENKWLHTWAISYYLFSLISRYDTIDELDLILPNEILGNFGYTSIKLLAERGTKVRLLTSPSIKPVHFASESADNITIREFKDSRTVSPSPKLGYTIMICRKEVHAEKLGENIYSDDPIVISDLQSDFNTLWDQAGGKHEENRETQSAPRSRPRSKRAR